MPTDSQAADKSERIALRRGVGYLLGSLVLPGSTQLAVGHRRVGVIALRVIGGLWLAVIVVALLALIWRTAAVTVLASGLLWTILSWLIIGLGLAWAALILDAWRLSRPLSMARRPRLGFGIGALVLAIAVFVASLGLASMARAQGDLLGSLFGGGGSGKANQGRINVLLLGGDAGVDRDGLRPDSITVASIDADTGRTVLFSLPRNLEGVRFPSSSPLHAKYPQGFDCADRTCLLNAVYTLGQNNKDLYPGVKDPGVQATKEAVEETLGLRINYYAMIDLMGFTKLIDALGGITIDVNKRVPIGGGTSKVFGYIEPGKNQHLDGYHALWFARSRHGSTDYERMIRQKCVMNAMLNQLNPATVVVKFNDLAGAGKEIAVTDVPASDLNKLMGLARKAKAQPVSSVSFTPPLIYPGNPKFEVIRSTVTERIAASEALDKKGPGKAAPPKPKATTSAAPSSGRASTARPSASASKARTSPAPDDGGTPQPKNDDLSQVCAVS